MRVVALQSSGRGLAVLEVDVLERIALSGMEKTSAKAIKDIPHAWSVRKKHQDRYEVCST